MLRKVSLRSLFTVLFTIGFLFVVSAGANAQNRGAVGRLLSSEYSHRCEVPYNMSDYGYVTGLHIVADWTEDLDFTLKFFCGGLAYATTHMRIGPEGWTGLPEDLLPEGVALRFPTLIYVYSHIDPENVSSDDESFWVTQFHFSSIGFSHQTFTSHVSNDIQ